MSSLISKIALVVYAGAIFCAALATSSAVRLAQGGAGIEKNAEAFRRVSGAAPRLAEEVTLEEYAPIRPDLFVGPPPPQPSAPPPAPGEAPVATVVTDVQMTYVLKGTLIHSNPALSRAFIEIPGVEEERAYRIGYMVHGARVVSISDKAAELRRGEESLYLTVNFLNKEGGEPSSGQAPPARIERIARAEDSPRRADGSRRGYASRRGQNDERSWPARAERRSSRETDPDEILRRLPQTLRTLLEELEPQRRDEILRMEPSERMALFRTMLRDQRDRRKDEKNRDRDSRSTEGRRRPPRLTSLTP